MLSLTAVLKPGLVASTRYNPTCRIEGTTNRPSSFVVASNVAPVLIFVALTDAPTTFAPLGSVTLPVIEARSFCANIGAHTKTIAIAQPMKRRVDRIIRLLFLDRIRRISQYPEHRSPNAPELAGHF